MHPDMIAFGAVILVGLTAMYILIGKDWRFCILALGLQYIGVFLLVDVSWPVELAVTKMVAGWMSGAILGIAMATITADQRNLDQTIKFGTLFRILAAIIITLTISSLVLHADSWFPMFERPILWGSFLLIGLGILQLSLATFPLRVVIGLLTALSGFEILYAAMETSTLVTGLLAGINLGLALVGAYLLVAPAMESNP
jgi:hypothetical protein